MTFYDQLDSINDDIMIADVGMIYLNEHVDEICSGIRLRFRRHATFVWLARHDQF